MPKSSSKKTKSKSKSSSLNRSDKLLSTREEILEEKIKRMQFELESIRRTAKSSKSQELEQVLEGVHMLEASLPIDVIVGTVTDFVFDKKTPYRMYNDQFTNKYSKIFPKRAPDRTVIKQLLIGKGAYGSVFKLTYKGNVSALKVLEFNSGKIVKKLVDLSSDTRNELQREIYILNTLSGIPNFLKHHSVVMDDYKTFIFMECFNGVDLNKFIQNFKLTPEISSLGVSNKKDALKLLFKQLCVCLSNMHKKSIVHNDFHGANVIVNIRTMDFRIIDFGLSRCFGNFKHNVCMKNDELLEYELNDGYPRFPQISPWRTYDCGGDGCTLLDLIRADYWALTVMFCDHLDYSLDELDENYGKETISDVFAEDFHAIYEAITGEEIPEFIEDDMDI